MDVFLVRDRLIEDYREFTGSFVDIHDKHIGEHVAERMARGYQWPDPWLSLNPNFASGGTITELVAEGLLQPECERIFRLKDDGPEGSVLRLHQHQREAIEAAHTDRSYVLTTGTGSGKSLAYIVPIVDRVLAAKAAGTYRPGIKAIVVYPMNALANSQLGELRKFLTIGYPDGPPVRFDRYTGQESAQDRARIIADPPDILLTNYVMLELFLTRPRERGLIDAARNLQFLVLDELHTYRGRQGADVALLVRRLRDSCDAAHVQCVGTSATMTTEGDEASQRQAVAEVASTLFGVPVQPANVIGDAEITIGIYKHVPVLWREQPEENPWNLSFMQGIFNMASDSGLFRTREELERDGWTLIGNVFARGSGRMLPLYEAKMIHHFDHRLGTYEGQTQAQANVGTLPRLTPEQQDDPDCIVLPRYWVEEAEVDKRLARRGWNKGWLLGWRDIARSTDERTVISSIIARAAVGDKYLLVFSDRGSWLLQANLSSFVSTTAPARSTQERRSNTSCSSSYQSCRLALIEPQ